MTTPPEIAGPRLQSLVDNCRPETPLPTAVVHPVDVNSLCGAVEAGKRGLIEPILIGPPPRIRAAAERAGIDIAGVQQVPVAHSHAAAERAVQLIHSGHAQALMKGALHTDEFMQPIVARDAGLRTERRMSHVFVIDTPGYPRLLSISDAVLNIEPDLAAKRDIVQNLADLAMALGIARPRIAVLSAVETVTPKLRSTLDAAALAKMAERGQISGAVVDGPLAFDNAVSPEAADIKHIRSAVAGRADAVVVPNLETGNMLVKQLEYLAGARIAGAVVGARVPIVLTSRADCALSRMASCAIAVLYHQSRQQRLALPC